MKVYREIKLMYTGKAVDPGKPIKGPVDAILRMRKDFEQETVEVFGALHLDGRHRVINYQEVSRGTLTGALVHPREVFRAAIKEGALGIILVHNHPSGDARPSTEDTELTIRLINAGEIIGIKVLDHIIIGVSNHISLRETMEEFK